MRRAARGSRGGRSKPCSTVVHSLGAALDHDDPTVAKLAHADSDPGEAAGPTADDQHN